MAKETRLAAVKDLGVLGTGGVESQPEFTVVHIQSTVQTVFGIVDKNGDVVEKVPVNFEFSKLDAAQFDALRDAIVQTKAKVAEVKNNDTGNQSN